ncbi:MAG TPA: DUF3341 domain-containing protein [Phycisphaerae bacterium]|jgi:hypothetical protein|nr:DUF3341 domain-containing protein [Phycisphaerae bacterium]
MSTAVFCIATSEQHAGRIVDDLKASGFSSDDISVLLADRSTTRDFAHVHSTKAPEGAAAGAGTGGLLGGALGWLVGVGSLAIPGAGPFIAAGPLMAALSGAAIGAAAGGLGGALIGMGVPEIEARQFEGKLNEGNVVLSVHSDDPDTTRLVKDIFNRNHASDVCTATESAVQPRE